MSEQVQTGGLMQFKYPRGVQKELDIERRDDIKLGYIEAEERKKKEKRNKWALFLIIFLVIVLLLIYIILKN